jgi:2-methylisocitrate lyase-like PEP mutase family enzyme
MAAGAGLVGGSIEDATGRKEAPIFDLSFATDRVAAAAEAARTLPFPFTLTARAENYLNGRPDLDDTIKRLQAYEKAGADVLFAPALPDLESVRTVCSSLGKPVNFMVGIRGKSFSVAELTDAGVRRISLATSLYRAAMTGLINAAKEVRDSGTFTFLDDSVNSADFARFLQG